VGATKSRLAATTGGVGLVAFAPLVLWIAGGSVYSTWGALVWLTVPGDTLANQITGLPGIWLYTFFGYAFYSISYLIAHVAVTAILIVASWLVGAAAYALVTRRRRPR
jgi:cellulose synthase/poly-beta-1,6-N-acetylglucosamine synthase-like glycosyltransferase